MLKIFGNGLLHYLKSSNETLEIFLAIDSNVSSEKDDIRIVEYEYKKQLNFLLQIELENPALSFRIYLDSKLSDHTLRRLIEETLEHDPYNRVPIGLKYDDCYYTRLYLPDYTILSTLAFLTCRIHSKFSENPVEQADYAIKLCDYQQKLVHSLNSSAHVVCLLKYATINGFVGRELGSARNFEAFYCRIASKLKSNSTLSRFAMLNVFDLKHYVESENRPIELEAGGLWRRIHNAAYDQNAFVDVTEEFSKPLINKKQKRVKFNSLTIICCVVCCNC